MKRTIILLTILSACVSRQEVEMDIWINEQIPAAFCTPELQRYGIYRVVLCKNKPEATNCQNGEESYEEFIPYCSPTVGEYLSMHREDAEKWLEKLTRPRNGR